MNIFKDIEEQVDRVLYEKLTEHLTDMVKDMVKDKISRIDITDYIDVEDLIDDTIAEEL